MIDFVATEAHFADHLAPIWHGLDPRERGRFWHMGRVADHLLRVGVSPAALEQGRPHGPSLVTVVASHQDYRLARDRPVVLVNHGAGQRYLGTPTEARHPSYSGGSDRDRVVLYLCPGEADAAACREAQPEVPAVAVGCPKLDGAHVEACHRRLARTPRRDPPLVAFGWHSDLNLLPETRSAFPHYERALRNLAQDDHRGFGLIGHSHPRAWPKRERFYAMAGIEPVRHFAEVLARADLYVADNSSTLFEAASCDVPVVVLNAPWYRRDVEHGLRFWEAADVGIQVDEPEDLCDGIALALEDPPWQRDVRKRVVDGIYLRCDGRATERAVAAIREVTT